MSLEKSSIVWSAKQLKGMVANGKINFEHIVQRSYVWERSRKSSLIESMILGYPIPMVYAKRVDMGTGKRGSNIYYIMDGKQRLSTIKEFLCDEFALTALDPITFYDDNTAEEITVDISEKLFSELPEGLQDYLLTVTLNVTYFDNLTKEEERELFRRLNNGKPLSTKSRMLANCKDIEKILDIGSHELFAEMLTTKSLENKNQATLVMKAWCMLNQNIDDVCFDSKVFHPMVENTVISAEEKYDLVEIFDFIVGVHQALLDDKKKKIAKKLYTETHFVSLIPFMKKAMECEIDDALVAAWIEEFFEIERNEDYQYACGSGSAHHANIVMRNSALKKSFCQFFESELEE